MSKKVIILIVIIVLVVLAGWWFMSQQSTSSPTANTTSQPANQTPRTNNVSGNVSANTAISAKDNSDAALNQDLNNVDSQMNGLNSDNANASQSLTNPNQ